MSRAWYRCPRCGEEFPGHRPKDQGPARDGFLRHAARDHDLSEEEALALIEPSRPPAEVRRAG